jgi:uncharacterized membrane protein
MFTRQRSEVEMMKWMNWPNWTAGWSDGLMAWDIAMFVLWNAWIVLAVILIATQIVKRRAAQKTNMSQLDALKACYVKGQINKDEFDRMRRNLVT